MLVIRDAQVKVFEAHIGFENRMLQHCHRFFPLPCKTLGDFQVRKIIQYGINKAGICDFKNKREQCIYISLMFLLGSDFDRDFQIPWAGRQLKDKTIKEPFKRIEHLYNYTLTYFNTIAGAGSELLIEALLRIRSYDLKSMSNWNHSDIKTNMSKLLEHLYPEKSRYQGPEIMGQVIDRGIDTAGQFGLTSDRNTVIFIVTMFLLGSYFYDDLQFPWANNSLYDDATPDQDKKADRLYKLAIAMLNRSLPESNNDLRVK